MTEMVELVVDGNHVEEVSFLIIDSPQVPVILDLTWLVKHNPHIDWQKVEALGLATSCLSSCHSEAKSEMLATSEDDNYYPDLLKVLEEYHKLKEVFNKTKATALLPQRPYDCGINILPGNTPHKGRLYSLSASESQAMEKYISESLRAGIICPSPSPAGACYFFEGRKDGSLRPCIDYRALNEITPFL